MSKNISDLEVALNSMAPDKQGLVLSVINSEGFDINLTDEYGNTPLHLVAYQGNAQAIRALVNLRANIYAINAQHKTPLYCAASSMTDTSEAIRVLIELGADPVIPLHGIPPQRLAIIKAAQAIDKIYAQKYVSDDTYVSTDDKCSIQALSNKEDAAAIIQKTKTIFEKKLGNLTEYPAFLKSLLVTVEFVYEKARYPSPSEIAKSCPIGKALHEALGEEPTAEGVGGVASASAVAEEAEPVDCAAAQAHPSYHSVTPASAYPSALRGWGCPPGFRKHPYYSPPQASADTATLGDQTKEVPEDPEGPSC